MTDKPAGADDQSPQDPTRVFADPVDPQPWWQTAPTTQLPGAPDHRGYQPPAPPPYGYGPPNTPQQPYYPGQQPFPGYPPPRRSSTGPIVLGILAGVIFLVGSVVVGVVLAGGSPSENSAKPTTPGPITTQSTVAPPPGKQFVKVPSLGISYAVPSSWVVESAPYTRSGAGSSVTGYGKTVDSPNYCPGSIARTMTYVAKSDNPDLGSAATRTARIAAEGGYAESGHRQLSGPSTFTGPSGLIGQLAENKGPWQPRKPGCTTDAYVVYSFAFKSPRGETLVLTIESDQDTRTAAGLSCLTADEAHGIIRSIGPLL
ncbi:hypothetical protein [Nocardia sp. NPDC051832]|uniref:hypothetical protein n=1 Tax=Nocardia sp. NPDC051832 TaxID=3155673 RepID=UPI00344A27FE